MLLSAAETWSSLDVIRRSSFASCCVLLSFFPPWTSRGFEAHPNSPHADDLASTRPYLESCFSNSNLALKGGVLYHRCFFFMGSLSKHFVKCDQWPIVVCNYFAFSRRTFSFGCYYCWLRKNFLLSPGYILFREEMLGLTTTYLLGVWSHGERECITGLLRF